MILFNAATPTPIPTPTPSPMPTPVTVYWEVPSMLDGAKALANDLLIEPTKQTLLDQVKAVLFWLFNVLSPFVEWGCKSVILVCIVTLYCSNDKRAVSYMLKSFFIYIFFELLKGAIAS